MPDHFLAVPARIGIVLHQAYESFLGSQPLCGRGSEMVVLSRISLPLALANSTMFAMPEKSVRNGLKVVKIQEIAPNVAVEEALGELPSILVEDAGPSGTGTNLQKPP